MFPSLLTKSSAKTTATAALSGSVTAPFRVRRCCYSAPLLEQVLRASSSRTYSKPSPKVNFRDDHHHSGARKCYHTQVSGPPTPPITRYHPRWAQNRAAALLSARTSLNPFWSTSKSSLSTASPGSSDSPSSSSTSQSSSKQIFRQTDKIESYFSAIGGHSDGQPPPNLTSGQVTRILRTNEALIYNVQSAQENEKFIRIFNDVLDQSKSKSKTSKSRRPPPKSEEEKEASRIYTLIDNPLINTVYTNQLASNHPIEDRLRVTTLKLESIFSATSASPATANGSDDACMGFGVFDGHNGGLCADVISRRLFHYIAVALRALELRNTGAATETSVQFTREILSRISKDHQLSPDGFYHNIHVVYEDLIAEKLQARIEEFEWRSLEQFAKEELEFEDLEDSLEKPTTATSKVESAIRRAFLACDRDLSREIQVNLLNTSSNVLLHYYLSLAVSGSCATVVILYRDEAFVASTGDCRAVMGTLKQSQLHSTAPEGANVGTKPITKKILKSTDLSFEHNSENISELNRLYSEHPKEEQNYIIRENRLLGQLMPLRAFGDFSFKWSVEKMKQLGLTRAFGSHIIPTGYKTPPYLTAEPEIMKLNLVEDDTSDSNGNSNGDELLDRFIILATDGLWEQFEGARKVVKAVNRYRLNVRSTIKAYTSENLFKISSEPSNCSTATNISDVSDESDSDDQPLTLGKIVDRLKEKITEPPETVFERITSDDDLIEDINCATFLLRTALSDISTGSITGTTLNPTDEEGEKFSHHVDQVEQQRARHAKLVSYLTLPQSVVRNFRDDISMIVIGLK